MERLDGHDELLSRISAADPAARVAPMTEGTLDRVTRHAMSPAPKVWTGRRFQLASLGALFGSGALVVAGILGIEAAAQTLPNLPIIALGSQGGSHKAGPNVPGTSQGNAMMIPYESFHFTVDPSLSSSTGTGTAYELSPSIDASTAASQVAQALSVSGDVVSQGDGSFQVGPDNGPYVSTWTSNGVVGWYYESASTITSVSSSTPPTDPSGSLPSSDQAAQWALSLLGQLGVTSDLGARSVSAYDSDVDVTIPILVDGLSTDQTFFVAYGAGSTVTTPDSASGEYVTAAAETSYPTISQTDAANVVIADNGFVFCGGVRPMNTSSSSGASGASGASNTSSGTGSSPGAAPSGGPVGDASPPFTSTTDTTPTTIQEPMIDVDLNQATMQLATFSGADGSSWLLPSWAISGPETGSAMTADSTYTANVLAVNAQYVQLQACPMVY
jgi:hypothetical protein